MSQESHRQLVEHLYESSGDTLRGVVRYHDGTVSPLYLRDDVDAARFKRRAEYTIALAQRTTGDDTGDTTADPAGYHIELFDGVVAFYLREGSAAGTVVAIDSILARNLLSLMRDCKEALVAARRNTKATA